MAEIYDQAEQFKADLVRRERIAASQLVRQYGRSWKRLRALLTDVTDRIETARRQGIEVSPAWLYQQQRYQALIAQVEREVLRYVEAVDSSVQREQAAAIRAATRHAATAIRTAAASTPFASVTVTALPVEAITSMVGFLADGSPLSSLLAKLPPGMSREVGDALTEAVTLGYNPRKTAAIIRHRAGMTLSRSLTIARTETLRAYREATHQTYKANSNIVAGWYWVASLSRRTCAACIALHGTFHTMEERMSTHVRCRCTSIPGIKGDPSPFTENGEEWFAKQSAEVQRAVFSNNAAYQAYRDGQAKLTDFVGKQVNPVWGDSYVQLGAKRALAGEGRFPGYDRPQPGSTLPAAVTAPQPAGYRSAATTIEAQNIARELGIGSRVDYSQLLLSDANKINKELGAIFAEWRLKPIGDLAYGAKGDTNALANGSKIIYNGERFSSRADMAQSYADSVTNFKAVSLRRLSNLTLTPNAPVKLVKAAQEAVKYEAWSVKRSVEDFAVDTLIHEAGHVIEDQVLGLLNPHLINDPARNRVDGGAEKFRQEWKRIYKNRKKDRYKISMYGNKNLHEYFAESFLMYYRRPQDLPSNIRDYFDRLKAFSNK